MLVNFYILHGVTSKKTVIFVHPKIYFLTKIVFAHPSCVAETDHRI